MIDDIVYLYGGDQPWDSRRWTASDDRVRGGASTSHLTVSPRRPTARFHGHLDTQTLGGAGFASQRTRGALALDLRAYDGVVVSIAGPAAADGKRYALTLKDSLEPPRRDGRDRAGVSWEADFVADRPRDVKLVWSDFKPTYRGRPKEDAEPLDLAGIKRVGLMMRSFFGQQEGDFSLELHAIAAWKRRPAASATELSGPAEDTEDDEEEDIKAGAESPPRQARRSRWRSLFCGML
ncbi:complex I intermediate-associated protein 30 (CIA30) domain-containing protein [Hirsutella rhossiliensis]|uniref:Complex I intermediate-associated protein 30 (CIA30) domain-containing protein n=1 Tax=Hirsutella rhossiliensis TaxID=111463 RepID=A0A9P8SDI7_9HYPO|nr:complex I intermediate-associated protein 30 (CIA30) domain-containing protein [Hirsutella rhossiliensis]KAH0958636.1 complex I intermediate-associated protein 30 (CIA30) domain-containing protein [Hirsutella rhossiliensis]